jgi:hypothetical protein
MIRLGLTRDDLLTIREALEPGHGARCTARRSRLLDAVQEALDRTAPACDMRAAAFVHCARCARALGCDRDCIAWERLDALQRINLLTLQLPRSAKEPAWVSEEGRAQ